MGCPIGGAVTVTVEFPTLASLVRELVGRGRGVDAGGLPAAEWMPNQLSYVDMVETLASATALGGTNDPTSADSIEPWKALIERLTEIDPEPGGFAARRWYAALVTAELQSEEPVRHRAFAASVAGVIDAYLGNDVRAEHWLQVGHVEAEFDETELTTFDSACGFVRTILVRRPCDGDAAR